MEKRATKTLAYELGPFWLYVPTFTLGSSCVRNRKTGDRRQFSPVSADDDDPHTGCERLKREQMRGEMRLP